MLEFTATIEKDNTAIAEKYRSKIIYKYDLIEYRHEKYSKEIEILENDVDKKLLMLGAVILSEYRRFIASDNKINIKPVILFKAHKTMEESRQNQEEFLSMIENLNYNDINSLTKNKQKLYDPINEALEYFNKKYNNINTFIDIIKDSFKPNYLINTNEKEITKSTNEKNKKEIEEQEKILNSLESSNNPVRAIFSVNKLNEGWDVLNLFDIVSLYTKSILILLTPKQNIKKYY